MYFRSGKILYFSFTIVSLAIILCTTFWVPTFRITLILLEYIVLFGTDLLIALSYNKRFNRLVLSYQEHCDPELFLEQMDSCLRQSRAWYRFYRVALIHRGSGLAACGRFEEAILDLTTIDLEKLTRPRYAAHLGSILNCLAKAYLWEGDDESADQALHDLEGLSQNTEVHPNVRQVLQKNTVTRRYEWGLLTGSAQGAEDYFSAMLQISTCTLERVTYTFYLGWAQLLSGKKEEAARNLQAVAKGAPKLFIAQRAREMLAQCRSTVSGDG